MMHLADQRFARLGQGMGGKLLQAESPFRAVLQRQPAISKHHLVCGPLSHSAGHANELVPEGLGRAVGGPA